MVKTHNMDNQSYYCCEELYALIGMYKSAGTSSNVIQDIIFRV